MGHKADLRRIDGRADRTAKTPVAGIAPANRRFAADGPAGFDGFQPAIAKIALTRQDVLKILTRIKHAHWNSLSSSMQALCLKRALEYNIDWYTL